MRFKIEDRFEIRNLRFKIKDFRFDVIFETRYLRFEIPISDVIFWISNLRFWI